MKITEVLQLLELKDIPIRYNPWKPEAGEHERIEGPRSKSKKSDVADYDRYVKKSWEKLNKPHDTGIPYKDLKPAIVGMIKDSIKNKDTVNVNKILNLIINKLKEDRVI